MRTFGKKEKRAKRHRRVRGKVSGTKKVPRLSVFRSLKHIYAQLIDDENNQVLASCSDAKLKKAQKTTLSFRVGQLIAQKAQGIKVERVVFDRGGFKYHGRVKAVAEGAREGGLKF